LIFHSFSTSGGVCSIEKNEDLESERFPSGQRGQTVNLLAMPSEVRILPSPPGPPAVDRLDPSIFINPTLIDLSKVSGVNCSFVSSVEGGKFKIKGTVFDLTKVRKRFNDWVSSIDNVCVLYKGGSSSVGRASAFQAEGRGFDPRFPLHCVNPSTPRPEGQGLLRVDPERRFFTPSSKAGLGAAEWVKIILLINFPIYLASLSFWVDRFFLYPDVALEK
jgi:hypothetical protein